MVSKATQAAQLVQALRRRWMTTRDMLDLRVSNSPWKRLSESAHLWLKPGEKIAKRKGCSGLIERRVVRG